MLVYCTEQLVLLPIFAPILLVPTGRPVFVPILEGMWDAHTWLVDRGGARDGGRAPRFVLQMPSVRADAALTTYKDDSPDNSSMVVGINVAYLGKETSCLIFFR